MRTAVVLITVVLALAILAPAPAAAQSKWDVYFPTVIGLAEGGHLFTIAPPHFEGCESGAAIVWI